MIERKIRKYLNDIIDVAYKGEPKHKLNKYKSFRLQILTKELSSKSGDYDYRYKMISIYNPSGNHMVKTCLHELAHHIDNMNGNYSGHQKPFYIIYRRLIYASLDMGLTTTDEFYKDKSSSDRSKVRRMVDAYVPRPIDYDPGIQVTIKVYDAYKVRESLSNMYFFWNRVEQVWEKIIDAPEVHLDDNIKYLEKLGIVSKSDRPDDESPYYVVSKSSFTINPVVYIEAMGDTYNNRELLKQSGFFFASKKKKWLYKIDAQDVKQKIAELRTNQEMREAKLRFGILKR